MSKHVRDLSPGASSSFGFATLCCALAWRETQITRVLLSSSTFLQTKKSVRFPSPCAHIEKVRVTPNRKTTKVRKKNRLRRETVPRPLVTWFTYQDNVENRGRASEAMFVRFLRQDNVLQNLANFNSTATEDNPKIPIACSSMSQVYMHTIAYRVPTYRATTGYLHRGWKQQPGFRLWFGVAIPRQAQQPEMASPSRSKQVFFPFSFLPLEEQHGNLEQLISKVKGRNSSVQKKIRNPSQTTFLIGPRLP